MQLMGIQCSMMGPAIQEYDFTIVYCKGTENVNADALARRPEPPNHA